MSTATLNTNAAEMEWANEQIEKIAPNQEAIREFDASADGARYQRIAGMTMWENLGAQSLPMAEEENA
jgi:hypothetical protein